MKKAKYICLEGTEGVGKTTQTQKLVDYLRSKGYSVLQTKEPGTPLEPLTMVLRDIMLHNKYDAVLTKTAREFISQAIRSIHLERIIVPALKEYDFIIQDRGILSGYAYGMACGNSWQDIYSMACQNVDSANDSANVGHDLFSFKPELIYDKVIYLRGNALSGLAKAKTTKQEFEMGDAMESRGNDFITNVSRNMEDMSHRFNTVRVNVDGKNIEQVHSEILNALGLER
jgi:dTMP kinase